MMINLTPAAIEEVKRLQTKQEKPEAGLRVGVKGGGCSGLSYVLNFDLPKPGDNVYEYEGTRVFVDPKSLLYLEGMTLDYSDNLQTRGFKFINPNAEKSCGCGESFSV